MLLLTVIYIHNIFILLYILIHKIFIVGASFKVLKYILYTLFVYSSGPFQL